MRSKPLLIGALTTGIVLGAVRFGERCFADTVTTSRSTRPCFALVWRTETTSRKGPFEDTPHVETTSVLEVAGVPIANDVREVRCTLGFAGVVAGAARDEVRVYDTNSGAPLRTIQFDGPISSTRWSRNGDWIAAHVEPAGNANGARLQVVDVRSGTSARTVCEDAHLGPGYAWSASAKKLCWVIAQRPASGAGSADLECWSPNGTDESIARVAHATQDDGVGAVPWVGFVVEAPHLCGLGLTPRDIECNGLDRPDDE